MGSCPILAEGAGFFSELLADDDILDALAALHTARRLQRGEALQLPAQGDLAFDACGLPMQIAA